MQLLLSMPSPSGPASAVPYVEEWERVQLWAVVADGVRGCWGWKGEQAMYLYLSAEGGWHDHVTPLTGPRSGGRSKGSEGLLVLSVEGGQPLSSSGFP